MQIRYDGGNIKVWRNNQIILDKVFALGSFSGETTQYGFSSALGTKMNLSTFRIYHKALSNKEIRHNYLVEKARWGL